MNLTFINSSTQRLFDRMGFVFLIVGHALAAWFSFGFHHLDEHFQIWEWANAFSGLTPDFSHLPWEHRAEIRPWFQPFLHVLGIDAFIKTGILNPFQLATLYRFIYSFLNVWALIALLKHFKDEIPKWSLYAMGCLWFLPYIHARSSSENLSSLFLTFAFLGLLKKRIVLSGILFGFAFISRYQIALGLVGLGLTLLLKDRGLRKTHFVLLFSFLLPVALGTVLDRIGYGHWVIAPYRYFTVNLVQGVASTFNPYPWYQYFIWILQLFPVISIPLFLGWVKDLKKHPLSPLGLFTVVFFIAHMGMTNKEYRFLFPIMSLVILMALRSYRNIHFSRRMYFLFFLVNLPVFAISSLRGASQQTLASKHFVSHLNQAGDYWITNRDIFSKQEVGFYSLPEIPYQVVENGSQLLNALTEHPRANILLDGKRPDLESAGLIAVLKEKNCELYETSRPLGITHLQKWIPHLDRLSIQMTFRCGGIH